MYGDGVCCGTRNTRLRTPNVKHEARGVVRASEHGRTDAGKSNPRTSASRQAARLGCTEDLLRLASQGTGVLPPGDISVDLRDRLAQEASKVAGQVLRICIRALDYCPPVDITYGEYLRALITADSELVPDDARDYRTAFVSAFRDRGIYPAEVWHMSPASLVWEPPPLPLKNISNVLKG